jgi:hypothetical protein
VTEGGVGPEDPPEEPYAANTVTASPGHPASGTGAYATKVEERGVGGGGRRGKRARTRGGQKHRCWRKQQRRKGWFPPRLASAASPQTKACRCCCCHCRYVNGACWTGFRHLEALPSCRWKRLHPGVAGGPTPCRQRGWLARFQQLQRLGPKRGELRPEACQGVILEEPFRVPRPHRRSRPSLHRRVNQGAVVVRAFRLPQRRRALTAWKW